VKKILRIRRILNCEDKGHILEMVEWWLGKKFSKQGAPGI
jgi:hypothetical protein